MERWVRFLPRGQTDWLLNSRFASVAAPRRRRGKDLIEGRADTVAAPEARRSTPRSVALQVTEVAAPVSA